MKLLALILSLLLGATVTTFAKDQSAAPPKFPIPWGNSAGSVYINTIPQASQIGIKNCAASLTDGFPPLTFVPATAGGCPPFGADFNGILKQLSQWSQWQATGAPVLWDSSFSSSIGGYPIGAVVANASTAGCYWISTANGNASNPDTGGANWTSSCPGGGIGGTSTGSANSQIVTAAPFALRVGATVTFVAGFSNTGPMKVNVNGAGLVNVFRRSQLGATMSVGGEVVAGQLVSVQWDGTEWQCTSCAVKRVGRGEDFFGSTAPTGTLFQDGSCQPQATYPDLFAVIGSAYGSCSTGNFALPDSRGRVVAGKDGGINRLTSGGSGCAGNTIGTGCGSQNRLFAQVNLPSAATFPWVSTLNYLPGTITGPVTTSDGQLVLSNAGSSGRFFGTSPGIQMGEPSLSASITVPSFFPSGFSQSGGSDIPFITVQPTLVATKIIEY